MACVAVMNEQERAKLNGNSARNHSVYKCNHIFYCAAVASCPTQPITVNQELTSLLLPWIIWGGTTLSPSPRKSHLDQSTNAAWSTWQHLTVMRYLSKFKNGQMDRCNYSEPYLASNLLPNRGEQADSLEAEDRHHFQRWPSLTGPKINGCISLVAPRVPATASAESWCSGDPLEGQRKQQQAEHFRDSRSTDSIPSSTPSCLRVPGKLLQPAKQALGQKIPGQCAWNRERGTQRSQSQQAGQQGRDEHVQHLKSAWGKMEENSQSLQLGADLNQEQTPLPEDRSNP